MTSHDRPAPHGGIMDIAAYVPGRGKAPGVSRVYKLSSNETPLGASPAVAAAVAEAAREPQYYPDGSAYELRQAIGRAHGLNPDNILCSNGSDEILGLLCQTYLEPGDEAIFTEHGFLVYKIQILASGATPVVVDEIDLTANVDKILEAVNENTKIVFLANPNNPTGTYVPFSEVRRLQAGLPKSTLLVIDAAYAEYVRRNDYEAGVELVGENDNVVMVRTFSKIHGLAGLRLGWMYAPAHVVDAVNRIRGPFNVNAIALSAGVAAMGDKAHVEAAVAHNEAWLPRLTEAFEAMGLTVTPSVGNFVLMHFPEGKDAGAADEYLTARGVVMRRVAGYGLPNALRMTVGTEEANLAAIAALREFMAG